MPGPAPPPRVGDTIAGKYRIERPLGEGGMAVVFAATHLALGRQVALKFVRPWALGEDEVRQRFMREAHATFSLRSEHAVRMLDLGELPSGDLFLVMELLEGQNLADVIQQRGPVPEAEAALFIRQACDALAEAHGLGIVHRDLKPANLFLTTTHDGQLSVKVLDFGLAKIAGTTGPGSVAPLTGIATTLGTPKYMAPEQWERAARVDGRADIFSLGVILFQLLTKKVPHEDLPLDERLRMILAGAVPSPRGLRPEISETMARVVMRCLRPIPDERFATAKELGDALSYAQAAATPGAVRPKPPAAILNATGVTAEVPDALRRALQREVDVKKGFGSAAAVSVSPNNLAAAPMMVGRNADDGASPPTRIQAVTARSAPAADHLGSTSNSYEGYEHDDVRTEKMDRAPVMQQVADLQAARAAEAAPTPGALNRTLMSGQGTSPPTPGAQWGAAPVSQRVGGASFGAAPPAGPYGGLQAAPGAGAAGPGMAQVHVPAPSRPKKGSGALVAVLLLFVGVGLGVGTAAFLWLRSRSPAQEIAPAASSSAATALPVLATTEAPSDLSQPVNPKKKVVAPRTAPPVAATPSVDAAAPRVVASGAPTALDNPFAREALTVPLVVGSDEAVPAGTLAAPTATTSGATPPRGPSSAGPPGKSKNGKPGGGISLGF